MTHEITIPPEALEKAAMAAWECKREAHSGLMPAWLDVLPMVRIILPLQQKEPVND